MPEPLRLGISSSSFIFLIPKEARDAMSASRKFDDRLNRVMFDFTREMMDAINSADVSSMELYHSMVWDADQVLAPICDDPKVEFWSVHAPYGRNLDPSSTDPETRRASAAAYCSGVDVARRVGAKIVVVHPGAKSDYDMPASERINFVPRVIAEAADYAADYGIKIAVEPLPNDETGSSLEEVLWIVDRVNKPNVGVNIDVNHLFPACAIPAMIRKAGKRLITCHISDQDDHERHWLPFEGKLDWREVVDAFVEIGYDGPLIYETHIKNTDSLKEAVGMIVDNYHRLRDYAIRESVKV
jgi:sugar phosphate isomerase/epimerase